MKKLIIGISAAMMLAACNTNSNNAENEKENENNVSEESVVENNESATNTDEVAVENNENATNINRDTTENNTNPKEVTGNNENSTNTKDTAENNQTETDTKKVDKKQTTESNKAEYLQKLNEIEEGLADIAYLYENGVTTEMKEAESITYQRWDNALNEIYNVIMGQLSADEAEKLKQEQRQWIKNRDDAAKEASREFEGGTMESLEYISTQAQLTKERCYELVNNYME